MGLQNLEWKLLIETLNQAMFQVEEVEIGQGVQMEGPIIVVNADETEIDALRAVLERDNYLAIALTTLGDLEEKIQETASSVVILDLDTLPLDNRFIRHLKRQEEKIYIIGLSSRRFHPELQEAVSTHIYACLGKPVDNDELLYWLRSIDANE